MFGPRSEARSRLLLSTRGQDGAVWRGVGVDPGEVISAYLLVMSGIRTALGKV
jgi:hypothetical protein